MLTKSLPTLLFLAAAASQLGATDCGNVLRDPGFDLWCGDALCAWKVERGSVRRVPTWNQGDPGVELVGDDVAIEQLSPVEQADGNCIEFDLIADVELDAEVTLNVDVFGDGSIDHQERLPTAPWQPLSYRLPIVGAYRGVRFELTKRGSGRAVLAQIGAKMVKGCDDVFFPIQPHPAPLGAPCDDSTGCASGMCVAGLFGKECVACDGDGSCPAGSVCGLGDPTSPVADLPHQCVSPAARELGEQCLSDAECGTGLCVFPVGYPTVLYPGGAYGVCSTCRTDADCPASEWCGAAWPPDDANPYGVGPMVCSPSAHQRQHGEPCATNADCASSACDGAVRMQCDDGRPCATAATCPFGGPGTENGLQNGACATVGIQGGTCQ